ncbi:hypothetical protein EMIT07CA2_100140 [Brevibacillus sp. IT-7CA2]
MITPLSNSSITFIAESIYLSKGHIGSLKDAQNIILSYMGYIFISVFKTY